MTILRGAAADADISQARAVEDIEAGAQEFPFTHLSADDFERLAYALFKVSAPVGETRNWSDASMLLRGKDAGRDVLLHGSDGVVGVVQCKRLESAISLPEVFREVAKTVLMARRESELKGAGVPAGAVYFLALSHDPAETVVNFFVDPRGVSEARCADVDAAVREVIEKYKTLADEDSNEAVALVRESLVSMRFKMLRPIDLNQWLTGEPDVASRFFRARLVVDNLALDPLRAQVEQILRRSEAIPLLTDADLKIIKQRIESTPEHLRLTVGFASLFGYPREMFVGDDNLRRRVGRLATMLSELDADYLFWMTEKAQEEATRIRDSGEVLFGVHPFARQVPAAYLSNVAVNIVSKSQGGLFAKLFEKSGGPTGIEDDAARMGYVRDMLLASGRRYLRGDFGEVVGEGDLLELKMKIIRHIMNGIGNEQEMARLLDDGIAVLMPQLNQSAARLREFTAQNPSIFIMGMSGLDNPEVIKQMGLTIRALTDAKAATTTDKTS